MERLSRVPRSRGFTLIEIIVTLVIAGILAGMAATLMSSAFRSYFIGRELAQDAAEGTLAIERMTRDFRTVRSATAADIPTMTATAFTFVDIDGNTVSYALSGTSLNRGAQPLASNVNTLAFVYLKNDGVTAAGAATEVWYVSVEFTLKSQNALITFRGTVKPVSF